MTIKNSNYIKLIAIISMFIDHIGVILFPNQIIFRIIGRIAFPLFAFQLGMGYEHTRKFKKYLLRISAFGFCVQLMYVICVYVFNINENVKDLNIFFTLALGLLSVHFYNVKKYGLLLQIFVLPLILKYFNINLDYGLYGVILILIMYVERNNYLRLFLGMTAITLIYSCFIEKINYIQIYCLMSMMFIVKPLSLKLRIPGYVFYLFYPVHLAVLYIVSMFV